MGLNSIHCNPARPWQFVLGAGDEVVRVYDQRRLPPRACEQASRVELSVSQPVRLTVPPACALCCGGLARLACLPACLNSGA